MKVDRYTKLVLTIIAACLVWICLNGIPAATAQAQNDRFAISAAGHTFLRAYRLNVSTGEIDLCSLENGCKPIPGSRVQSGACWSVRYRTFEALDRVVQNVPCRHLFRVDTSPDESSRRLISHINVWATPWAL